MNDEEAAAYYSKPEAFQAGERVTPPRRKMAGHVPVRFPEATIQQIKRYATDDGVSVSNWIRRVVDRELRRRHHAYTAAATLIPVHVEGPSWSTGTAERVDPPSLLAPVCS